MDAAVLKQHAGRVTFDNVTFSYNGNSEDAVLKGVSFTAEPGQTVAVASE